MLNAILHVTDGSHSSVGTLLQVGNVMHVGAPSQEYGQH